MLTTRRSSMGNSETDSLAHNPMNSGTVMCKNCYREARTEPRRRSGSPTKKRRETKAHPAGERCLLARWQSRTRKTQQQLSRWRRSNLPWGCEAQSFADAGRTWLAHRSIGQRRIYTPLSHEFFLCIGASLRAKASGLLDVYTQAKHGSEC